MFEEKNKKTLEVLKKHQENVTSIINEKISSINQRLDKLILDINNNLAINEVRGKISDLTLSLEASQSIWETENKKLKGGLTNWRSNLEKKILLKNKLRILEDMSRKTNIPVECIPGSENEGWHVMKVKLRKVIIDELDIGIVVIE